MTRAKRTEKIVSQFQLKLWIRLAYQAGFLEDNRKEITKCLDRRAK